MTTVAAQIMRLFEGFQGAHGTYEREDFNTEKQKQEIKRTARTVREPVTLELWQEHLAGRRPLGIIPIRGDNCCMWACVDIDKYDIDLPGLVKLAEELKIPAVVCRTKSGGGHLFMFFSEPVQAREVMAKMREIAAALGHGDSEIFPKQNEVLLDRGDLGNWLNMPYFEAERSRRYAVKPNGNAMSVEEFLKYAAKRRITREELLALKPKAKVSKELEDGPPCLQHLASLGLPEGTRNNGLFAFGVLARRKYPDDWEKKLEEWNNKFLKPPLPSTEVQLILRSLRRKEYQYRCSDQPIVSCCNSSVCRSRKYGVGDGGGHPLVSSLSILDTTPPLFFVNLSNGGTVECTSAELLTPRAFQQCALEQQRVVIPQMKQSDWHRQVQACMDNAVLIAAPKEVGQEGHFFELLERFCTDKHQAKERDELLLGKPWLDDERPDDRRVYFRLRDLDEFLERAKFREYTRMQVTTRIRKLGGDHGFFNLKGRGTNVWWVPDIFEKQTEGHDVPRVRESPI